MPQIKIPFHAAIILDGNRRWAREKGLPAFEGHRRGIERITEIGRKARQMGIKILTVWAFSTENWHRQLEEKKYLMKLFERAIEANLREALKEQIRIIHLGRKDRIPERLKKSIADAEKKTEHFSRNYFCIALDYGGKDEIMRSVLKIQNSKFKIQNLNAGGFSKYLDTKDLPQSDVDLVIRTGGEIRTSGFMIWQAAYAEYIFVKKYLPDFSAEDFEECIREFDRRRRRFGK